MNAIVIASGLETGFIGDWCCSDIEDVLKSYQLSGSNYSFDQRLVKDFAIAPDFGADEPLKTFKFRFSFSPENEILVHSFDSGDMLLLNACFIDNSAVTLTHSIALPVSRYVVNRKINTANLPAGFRNLKELSMKLKNSIFLPMRNNIFSDSLFKWPYPSLHGIPETILLTILRYLKRKDIVALTTTCRFIHEPASRYLIRNKSKKN